MSNTVGAIGILLSGASWKFESDALFFLATAFLLVAVIVMAVAQSRRKRVEG